jgi:hypothetical protein
MGYRRYWSPLKSGSVVSAVDDGVWFVLTAEAVGWVCGVPTRSALRKRSRLIDRSRGDRRQRLGWPSRQTPR